MTSHTKNQSRNGIGRISMSRLRDGRRARGQALVEYSLILALIAVVCIAVLTEIGQECRQKLELVEEAIAK